MIAFDRLWTTMKKKKISQYKLIKEYGVSTGQLDRLRKNDNVSTFTLNQLCRILNCQLEDIAEYVYTIDNCVSLQICLKKFHNPCFQHSPLPANLHGREFFVCDHFADLLARCLIFHILSASLPSCRHIP